MEAQADTIIPAWRVEEIRRKLRYAREALELASSIDAIGLELEPEHFRQLHADLRKALRLPPQPAPEQREHRYRPDYSGEIKALLEVEALLDSSDPRGQRISAS